MQTNLADFIKNTPQGIEADSILRKCVHCGFCTATCPTYQLLGDELDGPRGRIYLIKQVLEGQQPTASTRLHLDRCLTCRNCETTCPSGVRYGRLVEIGREVVERQAPRGLAERVVRFGLRTVLPYTNRFAPLLRLGQLLRPLLPASMAEKVPVRQPAGSNEWPESRHERRMLWLTGCVQPAIAPNIDAAAARVLDALSISAVAVPASGCCGAVSHHTSAPEDGLDFMRRNIDAWWPQVEAGAEAVVATASACGLMIKEYGEVLSHDPAYAEKAARISGMTKDLSEVLREEPLEQLQRARSVPRRVAFHPPCTLQHGQKLGGVVESLLVRLGFDLTPIPDAHLCCGSAGTYSILQATLSKKLLHNKVEALQSGKPDLIATANIGCLTHLQSGAKLPVKHWIELLDPAV